ncbi:elongation factor 4 [Candidatus Beckwithbacteria bacterium]|nr:elongation factor 4 [Candidatus Beckwithbacteria bacterium]
MNQDLIRNFSIIAHIDHGKSTLADRLLEVTKTVSDREMQEQFLDSNPISRERGITIKLAPVRMNYPYDGKNYILNLIDTPGHVDFSYEVSRALAACEGAILLVDSVAGIQAQTLTVYRQAKAQNLTIIPVLNKIDLPGARVEEVSLDLAEAFGFDPDEVLQISAKSGLGVEQLLQTIIAKIPSPIGNSEAATKTLVFDSRFDQHQGVIADVRVFSGTIKTNEKLKLMAQDRQFGATELGFYQPKSMPQKQLVAGEVGYICTGLKSLSEVKVGDTITAAFNGSTQALPGYKEPKPMVFLGLYPTDNDAFNDLAEGLEKLHLNDASFVYTPDFSGSLGKGFRVGFAGLLHAEIVQERLEREFDLDLIATVPNVVYEYELHGQRYEIQSAQDLPDQVDKIFEPWLTVSVFTPKQYLGSIMELFDERRGVYKNLSYLSDGVQLQYELPMAELITDFFDRLKSVSSGYASLDYELIGRREVSAIRLDILIHFERVEALSQIVVKDQAQRIGQLVVKKLKKAIPRQMFEIAIQAAIGGTVIARETVKAFRKDVTAKLYGGDVTRRMKLLEKQKKGKKRMKRFGKVNLPQEVFMAVVKRD